MDETGTNDDLQGGLGGDSILGGARDTRMLERAVRERWAIPLEARRSIPKVLQLIADDASRSDRNRIAAARALAAMDSLNMEQEKRDLGIPDHVVLHHREAAQEMTDDELRLLAKLRRRAELVADDRRSE